MIRLIKTPRSLIVLLAAVLALGAGIVQVNQATAAIQSCYSLTLVVDGGMGSAPTASSPNCSGGRYAAGTVVTLTAHPGPDSSVYNWRGTDHDTSTALTNTVTIRLDWEVGVHYVHAGNPYRSVSVGTPGGVATLAQVRSPVSVIGVDNRVQITPTTTPPNQRIVFLRAIFPGYGPGEGWGCTGTFYGPHTIITAGHCVYNTGQGTGGWATSVEVSAARDGSTFPYGTQVVTNYASTSGWVENGWPEYDYAAIFMPDDTLGNQVGWWSYGYFSDSFIRLQDVTISGYPGDKLVGTLWTDTASVVGLNSVYLAYTVDTDGGESGSPVYFLDSGTPVAAAIHVAENGPYFNVGIRINQAVADVLAGWGAANAPTTDCTALPAISLLTPGDTTVTNADPISFTWTAAAGASGYQFTLYTADQSTVVLTTTTTSPAYSYVGLAEGTYYWQAQALNVSGCPNGSPTARWQINVDRTPPSVPTLLSPLSLTQDTTPTFDWSDSTGGPTLYRLQVDNTPGFVSPEIDITSAVSTYTPGTPLALGTYNWQVQAQDAAGNWSAWSAPASFTLLPISNVVTKLDDTNDNLCQPSDCSLREAIAVANPGDTITFTPGLTGTILLNSTLVIDKNLTISGPGASVITLDAQNRTYRIFTINSGVTAVLSGLTMQHGWGMASGGGIYNWGTLTITDCVLSGNVIDNGDGGAIYNAGTLTISGSTLSGNSAKNGGAIYSWGSHTLSVSNSTFSGNMTTSWGGAVENWIGTATFSNSTFSSDNTGNWTIFNISGPLTLTHSTLSGSGNNGGIYNNGGTVTLVGTILGLGSNGTNCDGPITDGGYNLSDDGTCGFSATGSQNNVALNLGSLANNGGPTQTFLPLLGSPAIDAGSNAVCAAAPVGGLDQRGIARPYDGNGDGTATCDIGAVERNTPVPALSINDVSAAEGNSGTTTFTFTVTRSGATDGTSTVHYAAADGTATTANADYAAASGTITFGSGVTQQPVTVTVNGDVTWEPDETFFVNLSSPTFATISDSQGQGTILNDESTPSLSVDSPSISEAAGSGQFTVTLAPASSVTVTVHYAIADGTATSPADYSATMSGTLTFNPGVSTQPIPFTIVNDTIWEPNETFGVTLSSPTGGAGIGTTTGMATILDDETAAITLLTPANGSTTPNNRPTFTWAVVSGAVQYELQIATDSGFTALVEDVTQTGTSFTPVTALLDGTPYFWRVQAKNSGGQLTAWGGPWTVNIDTVRPAAPVLTAPADRINTADTTPTFTWNRVKNATQYRLQVDDDPAFGSPATIGTPTPLAAGSFTVPPLNALPYGVYYWRVQAGSAANLWSDWSVVRRLTITVLKTPANAQHVTDTTPTFTWAAVSGAMGYEFQLDDNADFSSPLIGPLSPGGTAASFTPNAALAPGEYFWTVRVQTVGGWSAFMPTWSLTVTPPPPSKPALDQPANAAVISALPQVFEWGALGTGYTYQLQIAPVSSFARPVIDVVLPADTVEYTVDALPNGGTFYWRVRGISPIGVAGSWSSPWSFTLSQLAAPTLLLPGNKTAAPDTTPDFQWNPVSTAAGYQIQISRDSNFVTVDRQASPTGTDYPLPDALPDGVYTWRVRAVSAANVFGKWSTRWSFTVDTTGPAAPVTVSPAPAAGTPLALPVFKWNAVADGKQYHVQAARNSDPTFAAPLVDVLTSTTSAASTVPLDDGLYLWHVQAKDAAGNWGPFSPTVPFAVTLLKLPKDGSSTLNPQPTFTWAARTGTAQYDFEVANNPGFSGPAWQYSGTALSTRPTTPLAAGTYYWHVRANPSGGTGTWMPTWTLIITPALPGRPALLAPAHQALTNDNTPTLSWQAATNGTSYQVQIDNNSVFSSPEQDVTIGGGLLNYIAAALPDGKYFWRVRAFNSDNAPGAWSGTRMFTLDATPPAAPLLVAPLDGASITNTKLILNWTAVPGAARYELQIDTDPAFPLPVINAGSPASYKPPTPISRALYFWHVRAVDAAGNASAWSGPRSFEIVAGLTAQTPPPTALPTIEPTAAPTETPVPPAGTLQTVESDDPAVIQTGTWTAHDTPAASGGRYLFSSGSADDALSLTFTGSRLDVIYVQHPALGTFVIAIDGAPVQLVDSLAPDSVFGARATVAVSAGTHTVRIYPLSGTIAIDAFAVEAQTIPPAPPSAPTTEPTLEPTSGPTAEPTVIPTDTPTETVPPTVEPTQPPVESTATPLPVPAALPFADSFDTGTGWIAAGAWRIDTGYQGAGWFADSTSRGLTSTLTYGTLIDLGAAQNPQLSFWQKAALPGGETISVEVSTDNGQTWIAADQQANLITDWALHTVDLSAYRGRVISLRFTLNTPASVPNGVTTVGYWLDNLAIQDVPPAPTVTPVPTEVPTEVPTAIPTPVPTDTPTATPTDVPTAAPLPTDTPTEIPTATPVPTDVPTAVPTEVPPPSETPAS